jgi:hypothetical protein
VADRITELQRELLAICRGSYAYETWAKVTEQPISERTDWRGRMRGQERVDEIRRELHAINPDAALYFGWGPSEAPSAKEAFFESVNSTAASGALGTPDCKTQECYGCASPTTCAKRYGRADALGVKACVAKGIDEAQQ